MSTSKDPVCGMTVQSDSPHHATWEGHEYFFCSAGCRQKFEAEPAKYVSAPVQAESAPPSSTRTAAKGAGTWTCPMHPEIVRDAPGSCPICGMALEPRTITRDEQDPSSRTCGGASPCRSR